MKMDISKRLIKQIRKQERVLSKAIRQREKIVHLKRTALSRNAPASEAKALDLAIFGLGVKCATAEGLLRQARDEFE